MLKINYCGDEKFLRGLEILAPRLGFALSDGGVKIVAAETENREIIVKNNGNGYEFCYYDRASFYRAFSLCIMRAEDGKLDEIRVKPYFSRMGSMQCAEFAVINVKTLKELIIEHALCGMDYMQLYTETVYEIDGEPYFGYRRGRYSKEEIKEIVAFGRVFGVKIVPAIQTLAHLANMFSWAPYGNIFDIAGTMLVNYEPSYALIEKMIATVRETFDTDEINLGMDEAYFMGFGRYNWFVDENRPDRNELFINHVKRVKEIAEKYGFTDTAIWFDNLFGMNYKGYIDPPEWLFKDFPAIVRENFPDIRLIFWNYGITDIGDFVRTVGYIRQLSDRVSFASMAHGYTSFAPQNSITERLVQTALDGCRKTGITDLLITWWGSKMSPLALMPSYYDYAERTSETVGYTEDERAEFLYGHTYTELKKLDDPNFVCEGVQATGNAEGKNLPLYALFDDPLYPLLARHVPKNADSAFAACEREMRRLSAKKSVLSRIYAFEAELCRVLSLKVGIYPRAKSAYARKDMSALRAVSDELSSVRSAMREFFATYRDYYLSFAKPDLFAQWESAFGAAIFRLGIAKEKIDDFVSGKTASVPELEREVLPVLPAADGKTIAYSDIFGGLLQ